MIEYIIIYALILIIFLITTNSISITLIYEYLCILPNILKLICAVFVCVIICIPLQTTLYIFNINGQKNIYDINFYQEKYKNNIDHLISHLLYIITSSIEMTRNIFIFIHGYIRFNKINNIPNYRKYSFINWGLTIFSNPLKIKLLKTKKDIIELINESKKSNYKLKIRVMNYGHSYSPLFIDNKNKYLFGKLLPDKFISMNPKQIKQEYNNNLTETFVKGYPLMYVKININKNTIIVGGATPILMYYNLIEKRISNNLYSFPSEIANVIQIHQSFVGTHIVSCHGSGINTTNITKYIKRLNIINYKGKEIIYKGQILKKMAANFGLLGIIVEMEIKMKPAYYALFKPYTIYFKNYLPENGNCDKFQKDIENNEYNELFWLPNTDKLVVHHFKIISNEYNNNNYKFIPYSYKHREWHRMQAHFWQLIVECLLPKYNKLICKMMIWCLSKLFFTIFPSKHVHRDHIKTPSINAIHPIYTIQQQRALSMEWCFPLSSILNDKGKFVPDCKLARDLFIAAKNLLENEYHLNNIYPQTFPLEMRIISGCDINLCLAHNVKFLCCIEITSAVYDNIFDKYCQKITDLWIDIIYKDNPNNLKYCRPHWCKYWQKLKVKNIDIIHHLKYSYKQDLIQFNKIRKKQDPNNIFLNKMFESLFTELNN